MRAFLPTDDRPVLFTFAAAKAARVELEKDGGSGFVRITMNPPEILSPRYAIDFEDELQPGDVVIDFDGLTVVVSAESARRLRGTVIDLVESRDGPDSNSTGRNRDERRGVPSSIGPRLGHLNHETQIVRLTIRKRKSR